MSNIQSTINVNKPPLRFVERDAVLPKLREIVERIDPNETLDPDVEQLLLEIADDFIEGVTSFACTLTKHRGDSVLSVSDVQRHLDRNWGIRLPVAPVEDSTKGKDKSTEQLQGEKRKTPAVQVHRVRKAVVAEVKKRRMEEKEEELKQRVIASQKKT